MKHKILICLLALSTAQSAFAERGMRDHHVDRMVDKLELSSEQEPAVRQILDEQHEKLKAEISAVREQAQPRMEALRAETNERLSTVLTAEQLQTFNDSMDQRKERMQERRKRWHDR